MTKYPSIINEIVRVRRQRWKMSSAVSTKNRLKKLFNNFSDEKSALEVGLDVWGRSYIKKLKEVPSKDIVEELEEYSEEERKIILRNIFAIELNKGCTGGCYFCLYGKKPGVLSKYSFKSLVKFKERYSSFMTSDSPIFYDIRSDLVAKYGHKSFISKFGEFSDNTTVLYNDSDSLTYFDNSDDSYKTFLDIYRLLVSGTNGHFTPVVTTSLPFGTEPFLLNLIDGLFYDHFQKGKPFPLIRFSLAKHNVERIEQTLIIIFHYLLLRGYSEYQIFSFFNNKYNLRFAIRDEKTIWKVGDLIEGADIYRDVISPHSIDGVVLSPGDFRVMVGTMASKEFPAGTDRINLKPGNVKNLVVRHETLNKFARFYDVPTEHYVERDHYLHFLYLISRKKSMIPQMFLDSDGTVFTGSKKRKEITYLLSRLVFSLRHQILFITSLRLIINSKYVKDEKVFDRYFSIVRKEFVDRTSKISNLVLSHFDTDKILVDSKSEFSKFLFHNQILEIILSEYEKNGSRDAIQLASLLSKAGYKHREKISLLYKKKVNNDVGQFF